MVKAMRCQRAQASHHLNILAVCLRLRLRDPAMRHGWIGLIRVHRAPRVNSEVTIILPPQVITPWFPRARNRAASRRSTLCEENHQWAWIDQGGIIDEHCSVQSTRCHTLLLLHHNNRHSRANLIDQRRALLNILGDHRSDTLNRPPQVNLLPSATNKGHLLTRNRRVLLQSPVFTIGLSPPLTTSAG